MSSQYYVGLMSGTSMDGIDAALTTITTDRQIQITHSLTYPWPPELALALKQLSRPGENEIERMGNADAWAGEVFAEAVRALLAESGVSADDVVAIGSHGQTIRHHPESDRPFTLQIGDPHRLAQRTGIATVADFRRRDIAAGGEGAPLVPAFHRAVFSSDDESRVILNIGGIANITLLPADKNIPTTGFDTGPGNRLLDDWIALHRSATYDNNGAWAASGTINQTQLETLLCDEYFDRLPPKSTGSEHFNLEWLQSRLNPGIAAEDVQATLLQLTVESIARTVEAHAIDTGRILVCGGGVHNGVMIATLQQRLASIPVQTTESHGIDPDFVEAAAFAWLAYRHMNGLPGNLPAVTGASQEVILGSLCPA